DPRRGREPHVHLLRPLLVPRRLVRHPARRPRRPPRGTLRPLMRSTLGPLLIGAIIVAAGIGLAANPYFKVNPYFYFAGYVILQYIVIATAWNILGGYARYLSFGTAAFFAMGAYAAVLLIKSVKAPLPVLLLAGGLVAGLLGLGIGYLTLRLRGTFFSIATLALAVMLQTMIMNWEYVGGSRG